MEQPTQAIEQVGFAEFIRQAWHVVEPGREYVHGWHIDAICDHLEALTHGRLPSRNLVINMPPRHMKSLITSVFWPAWVWTFRPEARFLYASYALSLSIRDSLKCRRVLESVWYQRNWGHLFELTGDQNAKMRFENSRSGYRIATSVGGSATGEGGDFIVADDPNNAIEAESDAVRESTLTWWDESMSTRGNDPKTVVRVIVQQRVHEQDLTGHVLEQGGYEHLRLPAQYESDWPSETALPYRDPRTEDGELLWAERFGAEELAELERRLQAYGAAGQLQQRPVPRKGAMFDRDWFPIVDTVPHDAWRVRYWDKAGTEGGGAYTAGVLMARSVRGIYYVEDVVRMQKGSTERDAIIVQTARTDARKYGREGVAIWHEQEPGSGGKDSAAETTRQLAGFVVEAERATGDKAVRAQPLASQARAGNVRLVEGDWNAEYLNEVSRFPRHRYKDQVDASSGAFNKLAGILDEPYEETEIYEEPADIWPV